MTPSKHALFDGVVLLSDQATASSFEATPWDCCVEVAGSKNGFLEHAVFLIRRLPLLGQVPEPWLQRLVPGEDRFRYQPIVVAANKLMPLVLLVRCAANPT